MAKPYSQDLRDRLARLCGFVPGCCRRRPRSLPLPRRCAPPVRRGAAIATVRRVFWSAPNLSMSRPDRDDVEIPAALWKRLVEALCYAV
jgi:hypothetical protein